MTWVSEWSESTTANGLAASVNVDLSSYAGQSAAEMRFHYLGDWAHCWAIDNVVVSEINNTPPGPGLTLIGSCPGVIRADATGMTPGGAVAFYYATSVGSTTLSFGSCAGLTLLVNVPFQLGGFVFADSLGEANLLGAALPGHCGVILLGAVDVSTCVATNVRTL